MTPHGGPRYDDQWPDVIDAEFWAAIRHMSDTAARTHRVAQYFTRAHDARDHTPPRPDRSHR